MMVEKPRRGAVRCGGVWCGVVCERLVSALAAYLGADEVSFTMNFSKGGSMIIAQYYQFLRLGFSGYARIMKNLESVAERLRRGIKETGMRFAFLSPPALIVWHKPCGIGGGGLQGYKQTQRPLLSSTVHENAAVSCMYFQFDRDSEVSDKPCRNAVSRPCQWRNCKERKQH